MCRESSCQEDEMTLWYGRHDSLQCVAVCCSVLQCGAGRCSVLQWAT